MLPFWMIALAGAIIFGLALYAGYLLAKLRGQNEQRLKLQQQAIKDRNQKIIESVETIALAALQKQCDLSEAAIRLYMLMSQLQGDKALEVASHFPALYALYDQVKDMARSDNRKTLAKKQRMQDDLTRLKAEAKLESSIQQELEHILIFTGRKQAI